MKKADLLKIAFADAPSEAGFWLDVPSKQPGVYDVEIAKLHYGQLAVNLALQ